MMKFESIIDFLRKEDVTLFVGSGCSLVSGAPSAAELSNRIKACLSSEYYDEVGSLARMSGALVVQDGDRQRLNEILVDSFSNLTPSSFHYGLLKIPQLRTIITTNYDNLIEKAYTVPYFQVFANDEELADANWQNIQLLKIHGDLTHLNEVVITEDDYRHYLADAPNPLLWSRVITEFTTKHIVFVGYSADDPNILNLIEAVKKSAKDKVKKMFIITPSLKAVQKGRLQHLGIEYIQGTGEEFLEEAFSTLKDTYGEDRYKQFCSQDTLSRFGLLSGVTFSFENSGEHTSITGWRSTNNGHSELQVHFDSKSRDVFAGKKIASFKEMIKGFSYPMYQLTPEELSSFVMRVNGLRINGINELREVYFGPAIKTEYVSFSSVRKQFVCREKAQMYADKGIWHICIPTPLYNMEICVDISSFSQGKVNAKLNTRLNESSFDNLQNAVAWTKLLTAFIECKDLRFQIGNNLYFEPLQLHNDSSEEPFFRAWLDYCMKLEQIERLSGQCFFTYEPFSLNAWGKAKVIQSFLTKEPFIDPPRKEYQLLLFDVDKGVDFNQTYRIELSVPLESPITLCGKDFPIKEEHIIIEQCSVLSKEPGDEQRDRVSFKNLTGNIVYNYADGEISEFYGIVHPIQ